MKVYEERIREKDKQIHDLQRNAEQLSLDLQRSADQLRLVQEDQDGHSSAGQVGAMHIQPTSPITADAGCDSVSAVADHDTMTSPLHKFLSRCNKSIYFLNCLLRLV